MKKNYLAAAIIILFYSYFRIYAQDSIQVVTLSPRVGQYIDLNERNRYGLFSKIKDFNGAFFVQKDDNLFCAYILMSNSTGIPSDTMIDYSANTINILSQKIDHYEELEEGRYQIKSYSPSLLRGDPTDSEIKKILKNSFIASNLSMNSKFLKQATPIIKNDQLDQNDFVKKVQSIRTKSPPSELPLAYKSEAANKIIESFFGFGIGFYSYTCDLSQLEKITGGSISASPMLWFKTSYRLPKYLSFRFEWGTTIGQDISFNTFHVSGLWHSQSIFESLSRLFIGVGFSSISFSGGSSILYSGGQKGMFFIGGIELMKSRVLGLELCTKYISMKPLITTFENTSVKINLSGLMFGADMVFYF